MNHLSRPMKWDILGKGFYQHKLKERNPTKPLLYRSTMQIGKEISEDMKKRVVTAYQSGEGDKTISKRFQLHPSTVRQIMYKWRAFNMTATLPRSGRPSKISPRNTRKNIIQVQANPHITCRELKTSLVASTVRRKLNNHDIHGRVARRKPLLWKKNKAASFNFAREHLDKQGSSGSPFSGPMSPR